MDTIPYAKRLLSNIGNIAAPERGLVADYFLKFDDDLKRHGWAMTIDDDMAAFDSVCRATGKFLPNTFNPAIVSVPRGDAVWMDFQDRHGERIATIAVRRVDLDGKTLGDWLSTLSFFYREPIRDMASGERFVLTEEADGFANGVRQACTLIGGLWLSPDWRGRTTLAEAATTFGAILALSRWNSAPIVAIVEDEVYAKNSSKYRFDKAFGGLRWHRPHKPERTRMWLLGRTRDAVIADAKRFLEMAPEDRLAVASDPRFTAAAYGNADQ